MSSEKNLRVRVKVFDNSTTIYSQDVEIIQGEGTFVVPAMLSDNEIIVLQVRRATIIVYGFVVNFFFFFYWNNCYEHFSRYMDFKLNAFIRSDNTI